MMKRIFQFAAGAAFALCGLLAYAVDIASDGEINTTVDNSPGTGIWHTVSSVRYDIVSDDDGLSSATLTSLRGTILSVVVTPGTGDDTPTNNYDITIRDEMGRDVLMGLGTNMSAAGAEIFTPLTGDGTTTNTLVSVTGPLTFISQSMGAANTASIKIDFRR